MSSSPYDGLEPAEAFELFMTIQRNQLGVPAALDPLFQFINESETSS